MEENIVAYCTRLVLCLVCKEPAIEYKTLENGLEIAECKECGTVFTDKEIEELYLEEQLKYDGLQALFENALSNRTSSVYFKKLNEVLEKQKKRIKLYFKKQKIT